MPLKTTFGKPSSLTPLPLTLPRPKTMSNQSGFSPSPSTTTTTSRNHSVDGSHHHSSPPFESKPSSSPKQDSHHTPSAAAQVASLGAVAIIGPIMAFPFVGDFVGRMAVVLVVGLVVAALRRQMDDESVWAVGERVARGEGREWGVLVGGYLVVMGVLAGVV